MGNKKPSSTRSSSGGSQSSSGSKAGSKKAKGSVGKGGDLLEGSQRSLRTTTTSGKKAAPVQRPSESSSGTSTVSAAAAVASTATVAGAGTIVQSNKIVICKQTGCHDIMTTLGYCRFHYLASWRKTKTKEAKKKGQELEVYLKDLSKKFPEEFIEKLKSEVDELIEKEAQSNDSEESQEKGGGLFDNMEDGDDLDTIISGLKVEDF